MKHGEPNAPDVADLAARIRDGDASAFDAFLNQQWSALVQYVGSMLGSIDDAKDVAQEAFVRLWEARAGLRPASSMRAYLYRIARNLAINELKGRELHRSLEARQAAERPSVLTPAHEVETLEVRDVVRRAIETLPERRREAFVLAHIQDLPHRDVAQVMGISPQTVANQISAALGDLRDALRPYITDPKDDGLESAG